MLLTTVAIACAACATHAADIYVDFQAQEGGAGSSVAPFNAIADANADGVVDGADLGLLLGAWGPCD